jgi:pyranose oxidase
MYVFVYVYSGNHNSAWVQRGQNPDQNQYTNLGASAATRVVGGMATHWTCATPRQLKGLERSELFTDKEWEDLYKECEGYLGTSRNEFEGSIRHQLVKNTLKKSFTEMFPGTGREILSLPLAAKRDPKNPSFVIWAASNTILGNTVEKLHLYPNHQCTKLLTHGNEVQLATIKNLSLTHGRLYVCAKKNVVCGGAVLTPQILYNSGFRCEGTSGPVLPKLVHPTFYIYIRITTRFITLVDIS